jgi:hypothetical protein
MMETSFAVLSGKADWGICPRFDIVNGFLNRCRGIVHTGQPVCHDVTKYKAEIYYPHPPDVVVVAPATGPSPVLSLVVRTLKREVRAFRGCLGMHRR